MRYVFLIAGMILAGLTAPMITGALGVVGAPSLAVAFIWGASIGVFASALGTAMEPRR